MVLVRAQLRFLGLLLSVLPGLVLLSFLPAIGDCDRDGLCADMLYPIGKSDLIILNEPEDNFGKYKKADSNISCNDFCSSIRRQ